jgi:hypothetical protein
MDTWSGGLFHYKKDPAYNTSKDCCAFYYDVQENSLLNNVFCYIVHNLPKLQNMHLYKITYLFSKELVAYLETLIAFSFYYRADDLSMSGKMEQFYTNELALYKDYQYPEIAPEFHRYIVRKMENWYMMFQFPSTDNAAEDDSVSCEEGEIVDVPAVDARTVSRCFSMSDDEAGVCDEDIHLDGEQEAESVAIVEAAQTRWANGAAAPLSPRQAMVRWRQPLRRPRPEKSAATGNKYTDLLNAVPRRALRRLIFSARIDAPRLI